MSSGNMNPNSLNPNMMGHGNPNQHHMNSQNILMNNAMLANNSMNLQNYQMNHQMGHYQMVQPIVNPMNNMNYGINANQYRPINPTVQDYPRIASGSQRNLEINGSHEDFWTFSQISLWGGNWDYANPDDEHRKRIQKIVCEARRKGELSHLNETLIRFAQLFIWRVFIKKHRNDLSGSEDIIVYLAYETAAIILDENISDFLGGLSIKRDDRNTKIDAEFQFYDALDYNFRVHNPSDYISLYINEKFTKEDYCYAENIISKSFSSLICLLYEPTVIAEGACVMAAGSNNNPYSVHPRSVKSLSFIQDMVQHLESSQE